MTQDEYSDIIEEPKQRSKISDHMKKEHNIQSECWKWVRKMFEPYKDNDFSQID